MKISVLVPTFRRPYDLERCLRALAVQTRAPNQIVVVARPDDTETLEFLQSHQGKANVEVAFVSQEGVVAALNVGLKKVSGELIAFTDDDAAPRSDWLQRIETHFATNTRLGGLGGRDWVQERGKLVDGRAIQVGKLQWFGRMIGNHHLGFGEAREVDLLKGVNMSYRREAIKGVRFDERLLGSGAQVFNEVGFALAVKRAGWMLIYDPATAVDHFPAPRADDDVRYIFSSRPLSNAAHNETLVLLDFLPPLRRLIYIGWSFALGSRSTPGLIRAVVLRLKGDRSAFSRLGAALKGRALGIRTWCRAS